MILAIISLCCALAASVCSGACWRESDRAAFWLLLAALLAAGAAMLFRWGP